MISTLTVYGPTRTGDVNGRGRPRGVRVVRVVVGRLRYLRKRVLSCLSCHQRRVWRWMGGSEPWMQSACPAGTCRTRSTASNPVGVVLAVSDRRPFGLVPPAPPSVVEWVGTSCCPASRAAMSRLAGEAHRQLLRADGVLELDAPYEMRTDHGTRLSIRNEQSLLFEIVGR